VEEWGRWHDGQRNYPGPILEIGANDTLNLTLNVNMMTPQESFPYNGHTVHLHGADVQTSEDGVPETNGNTVTGDTYTWSPSVGHEGSYAYHCHVHTVKHLEMGMYSAVIVRPRDVSGNFLNRLNQDPATAYDYSQVYVLSTVDPAYHSASGDSTVFADYNPQYFLLGGKEGKTTSAPALTLAAAKIKGRVSPDRHAFDQFDFSNQGRGRQSESVHRLYPRRPRPADVEDRDQFRHFAGPEGRLAGYTAFDIKHLVSASGL